MAKYKIGDKVKVRSDLRNGQLFDGCNVALSMEKYAGKIVTISRIGFIPNRYHIENSGYSWTSEMFEELETETVEKTTEIKLEGNMNFKIKSCKVIKNKAVIVEFEDGDVQRSVCMEGDVFDEERGIEVCIMKHICGGKDKYHKVLKTAQKQIKEIEAVKAKDKKAKEDAAKKKAKEIARKKARKERKRAEHISDMKTAFVKALVEYENTPFTTEAATNVIKTLLENDK